MSEPLAPQPVSPGPSPVAPAPVAPEPAPAGGFFQNLIDVFVSPREAFTRIVKRPSFWLPFVGWLVLSLGFTAIWMNKMDPREFMKNTLEESGQWDKIPADQREQILESSAGRMRTFGVIGPVLAPPVMLLIIGGVLLGIYRFFYASEMTFRQALAICAWTFFAVALLTTPLLLLVMNLKGDWNLNPQNVVQANPSVLFEKDAVSKPLYALLSSVDLFSLWTVFLLASGFAVASRMKTSAAIWGVAIPWLLIVLWKVGWAAIF
jgi:hypothetical protein